MGSVAEYMSDVREEDFVQARAFWEKVLGARKGQQQVLVRNVAGHVRRARAVVWEAVFDIFSRVTPELGEAIRKAVDEERA
ncbi:hypothetical protein C8A03DRAFT_36796 [Achaetomium macrosporum]|uniref:Catalase immune-responsive domain-containing protein n=1 Tax=Achaetomium macrosporum TaxID=79813 RepID=A0AAN7C4T0_9PEZI|nr:hypothetical protein C8A03DRAFT_36796 [Achaetomium macrosporum]